MCLVIPETCFFTIAGVPSTFEQLQNVIKSHEACSCAITSHAGKVAVLRPWNLQVSSPLCSCGMNSFQSILEVGIWTVTALPCRQSCCIEVMEPSSMISTLLLWHEFVSKHLRRRSLDHYGAHMRSKLLYWGHGAFEYHLHFALVAWIGFKAS